MPANLTLRRRRPDMWTFMVLRRPRVKENTTPQDKTNTENTEEQRAISG
jgi:hypothetical protein